MLQEMLDAAMAQASEESSMLLGQTMSVHPSDLLNTDRKSYLGGMEDALFVVGVESREAYPGYFYLIFALSDSIVMSSILLGIPPARIQEKRRLCIQEPDDIDAFSEIANQIIGSFNSVFQPKLPQKVHLKLLSPQKYVPEVDELSDELPFPEGGYVMFRAPLEIAGQEMNRLDIMVPHALAELFDPQPVEEEAVVEEAAPAEEPAGETDEEEAAAVPARTVLVLAADEGERKSIKGQLADCGMEVVEAPLIADVSALCAASDVRAAVISLRQTKDPDLAICNKVIPLLQKGGGSVLLCAPEWTRTSLMKALKAGARAVLMHPFSADELQAKIGKLVSPF